jgi:hypothetical protein
VHGGDVARGVDPGHSRRLVAVDDDVAAGVDRDTESGGVCCS